MRHDMWQGQAQSWDQRLYPGLAVEAVPTETRAVLVQAAGRLGVEAEYFLDTVRAFTVPAEHETRSRARGEAFLWQLEASAGRLRPAAESFEVATQAYLAALDASDPELRGRAGRGATDAEQWWPLTEEGAPPVAGLDLRMRQCGFSYRQVVMARLTPNVEALTEHLSLLLHAFATLPPVGVVPVRALYDGLYELAATFQGHVVPHLLADIAPDKPGLLAGIRRVRERDVAFDHSIEADIAWAQAQLGVVRQTREQTLAAQPAPAPMRRGGLAGLFRRAAAEAASAPAGQRAWLAVAEREWRETIDALEAIRLQATPADSVLRLT